ncbi:MAG: hypothetical protein H7A30_01325 [Thermotogae bacterium]|nr:hypothetical protein [Thermotogota bacterium]
MEVSAIWQDNLSKNMYYKERPNDSWHKKDTNLSLLFETREKDLIKEILMKNKIYTSSVIETDDSWHDIFGRKITKIVFEKNVFYRNILNTVNEFESMGKRIYGFNLPDIFDGEISDNIKDKRIWFLDIEVEEYDFTPKKIPISVRADGTIISIVFYDSFFKKYTSFVLKPIPNKDYDYERFSSDSRSTVYFNSEEALLIHFNKTLKKYSPDIISGWYSDGYDIPYIINRSKKYKIDISAIEKLKPYSDFFERSNGTFYRNTIPGTNLLDYMDLYKKYVPVQPSSYKLDAVAEFNSIEGKTESKGFFNYRKDFDKFMEYIFRDVEILVELEKKLNLISLICGLQSVIKIPLNMFFANSSAIGHYLSQFLKAEKKTFQKEVYDKDYYDNVLFEGATVLQPEDRTYKNTVVLDYASLYPNIIVTFNISPETLVFDQTFSYDNFDLGHTLTEEGKEYLPFKYRLDKTGVLPSLIKYLLDERLKYKALKNKTDHDDPMYTIYDIKQSNYKILLNSMYGVIGSERFPLHDKRVAASITAGARAALNYMNTKLDGNEFKNVLINGKDVNFKTKVIYSDTDSSFNVIESDEFLDEKDLEFIGIYLSDYINKSIETEFVKKYLNGQNTITECTLRVDTDKIFETVKFFGVKKRYFGLDHKNNIITHGVEIVRTDTPPKIKNILSDLFIKSIKGNLKEEDILKYFREIKTYDIEDIAISKTVTKRDFTKYRTVPNHVRAIMLMKEIYNYTYDYNDKLKYFYIKYSNFSKMPKVAEIFNIKSKITSEQYVSACIEDKDTDDFKKRLASENPDFSIDYYTFFDKNILVRLEQFSENKEITEQVRKVLLKEERNIIMSTQLKLF